MKKLFLVLLVLAAIPAEPSSVEGDHERLHAVVAFNADVLPADMQRVLRDAGMEAIQHADLLPRHALVAATPEQIREIIQQPEVAHVFPASAELVGRVPVTPCPGPMQPSEAISHLVHAVGNGWYGRPGSITELTYSAHQLTEQIPRDTLLELLDRVFGEWSRHAGLRFRRIDSSRAERNINIAFASGEHGDPYPFDGRRRVLAHAYYPAGVNPEPIAGDVHLDNDETWSIGGELDLYSVLLHEVGHALGLGHGDNPASVMYPYYRTLRGLRGEDVTALQELYPPARQEELLTISLSSPGQTERASVPVQGNVKGGLGDVRVEWSSRTGSGAAEGGRTWRIPEVSLAVGENQINLSATDSSGASVRRTVSITRLPVLTNPAATPAGTAPPVGGSADIRAPQLAIVSPASTLLTTSAANIRVSGTARDNGGIAEVQWTCGTRSGTAQGTLFWTFDLPLLMGDNSVVIRARDVAGNLAWRTLTITRR